MKSTIILDDFQKRAIYSDEKIDNIFASQLSEAEYRSACQKCIDNNGTVEHTYMQIEDIIKSYKE